MTLLIISTVLIFLTSIILILIVLVQNPKGGGLSASFGGGSNQYGGVAQTNKFLDKATWTLAVALLVFSISASMFLPRNVAIKESKLQKALNEISTEPVQSLPSADDVIKYNEAKDKKAADKKAE